MSGRSSRGQATVELVLALPILVVIIAAVIEIGALAVDHVRLWNAAREGARAAAVDPDGAAAERAAARAAPRGVSVEVVPLPQYRRQGQPVTVRVTYRPGGRTPLGAVLSKVTLTAAATMRIERP